jgi:hypothetical protein
MKLWISYLLLLITTVASAQLPKYKKEVDSLSKLYNKKVIGYSKSITTNDEPRESLLVFYIEDGEVEEFIAWTRVIDNPNIKIIILNNFDKHELVKPIEFYINIPVYYNNNLIGSMEHGVFTKIKKDSYQKYAVVKEVQKILENDTLLNNWLTIKFGGYYKKIIKSDK